MSRTDVVGLVVALLILVAAFAAIIAYERSVAAWCKRGFGEDDTAWRMRLRDRFGPKGYAMWEECRES